MVGFIDNLKGIIAMMAIYSMFITILVYALPADARVYPNQFNSFQTPGSITSIQELAENNLNQQKSLPLIDFGALLFYSGFFIVDLALNFLFAIPEMIGFLISGFTRLAGIDPVLAAYVQVFLIGITTVMYFISAIQFLINRRSSKSGGVV